MFSFRANISSDSSLNLSDSDKDPCLTSNEADDEQSDWPRDESSVPRFVSWKEEDENNDDDDDDDEDEKMLTTNADTLEKIINGAVNMVLSGSKNTIHNRIKSLASREMLTGNRRNTNSKVRFDFYLLVFHTNLYRTLIYFVFINLS